MTRPCETVTKAVLVLEFIICCSDGTCMARCMALKAYYYILLHSA